MMMQFSDNLRLQRASLMTQSDLMMEIARSRSYYSQNQALFALWQYTTCAFEVVADGGTRTSTRWPHLVVSYCICKQLSGHLRVCHCAPLARGLIRGNSGALGFETEENCSNAERCRWTRSVEV